MTGAKFLLITKTTFFHISLCIIIVGRRNFSNTWSCRLAARYTVCTTFNTVNALKDRPTLNYGLSCTRGHRLTILINCCCWLSTVHSLMTNCILFHKDCCLLGRLRNASGQLFRLTAVSYTHLDVYKRQYKHSLLSRLS